MHVGVWKNDPYVHLQRFYIYFFLSKLPKHFEERLAIYEAEGVDGVVNSIEEVSPAAECGVVVWEILYQGACWRDDCPVLSECIYNIEDPILIVVFYST